MSNSTSHGRRLLNIFVLQAGYVGTSLDLDYDLEQGSHDISQSAGFLPETKLELLQVKLTLHFVGARCHFGQACHE